MTFRPQTNPRRTGSRKVTKTERSKKAKQKKQHHDAKYLQEENPQVTAQDAAQRTINSLTRLGNQVFALSPFSQYFDDWLLNLRQVTSEFETNQAITVDDQFVKDRTQIFLDVEAALAQNRVAEDNLSEEAKALAENNHKIVEADKDYAEKSRDNSNKRNSQVQQLSNKIRQLEDELATQQQIKLGFFKFKEKGLLKEKINQLTHDLTAAKNELEITIQSFTAEQDKLHDAYMKHKQELNEISDRLHKELEKLETDTSTEARQAACNSIADSINSLLKRMPTAGS
jgi:hypothetical protein